MFQVNRVFGYYSYDALFMYVICLGGRSDFVIYSNFVIIRGGISIMQEQINSMIRLMFQKGFGGCIMEGGFSQCGVKCEGRGD